MKLLDRFFLNGNYIIRALHPRTGIPEDVYITQYSADLSHCSLQAAIEESASIWGGSDVPCVRHDGVLHYRPNEGAMSAAEFGDMDDALELAAAKQLAPGAMDSDIWSILERPMSCSQRRAALQELAS